MWVVSPDFNYSRIMNEIWIIWMFPKIGVPQNGWFILENILKWMLWGYHYFWKHPFKQVGIHLSQAKQELKGQRVGVCWIDWATVQCRCDQTAGWCHTYIWLIFMVFICQSRIACFGSLSCSLVKGNNKLMSCTMWLLQHMRPQPMRLKWKSSMQALLHDMNYFILAFSSV